MFSNDNNGNMNAITHSYDTDTTPTYDAENRLDDWNGLVYNYTVHREKQWLGGWVAGWMGPLEYILPRAAVVTPSVPLVQGEE